MSNRAQDPTKEDILRDIALGNERVFKSVYVRYRPEFFGWAATRFAEARQKDFADAWQDTMVMFYVAVVTGRLTALTCSLRSFLFLIGYRRLLRYHRTAQKTDLTDEWDANKHIEECIDPLDDLSDREDEHAELYAAIGQLSEKNRRAITLRYLHGWKIPDITAALGYGSDNTTSVTLSRILDQLSRLMGRDPRA